MSKNKNIPLSTEQVIALSGGVPSMYVNLPYFSTVNGMVRITFFEQLNETLAPRFSVVMTTDTLGGMMKNAEELLGFMRGGLLPIEGETAQ